MRVLRRVNDRPSAYERFKALHERDGSFVIPNAWDAASALVCKRDGSEAGITSGARPAAFTGA